MKRTPWAFFTLRLVLLIAISFLTYVSRDGTSRLHPSVRWIGDLVADRPNFWILFAACGAAVLEIAERVFGTLQFRKEKVQGILDHIVRDLFNNKPKEHRCTLFRAAKGYVVAPIVLYRALFYHEERMLHLRSVFVNPFGTYLYVWARARGNRNHRSCVAFRVHHRLGKTCEGMAGRVWEKDVFEAHDLPKLEQSDLDGVFRLDTLAAEHPAARYAKAGNVSATHQLKARERYARHFYGAVIESPKSQQKWGVLLVDSIDKACPWPTTNRGTATVKLKDFEKDFASFTVVLSTILT